MDKACKPMHIVISVAWGKNYIRIEFFDIIDYLLFIPRS